MEILTNHISIKFQVQIGMVGGKDQLLLPETVVEVAAVAVAGVAHGEDKVDLALEEVARIHEDGILT